MNKPPRKNKAPVWWHPSGQWCKKFRGRNYYFGTGSLDDALKRFADEWDDIKAGRERRGPGPGPVRVELAGLVNAFLTARRARVDSGEMTAEVWNQYRKVGERIVAVLGRTSDVATLGPADYGRLRAAAAAEMAPTTLTTFISLARVIFNYGGDLLDRRPRYGDQFRPPSQRVIRLHREAKGPKLIPADELRELIDAAGPIQRAQILLGLNCAFGAADCSELRRRHLDERPGWVVLPRRKTGVARRCPLWPETLKAVRDAIAARPAPADKADADRVFLSRTGLVCVRVNTTRDGRYTSKGDTIGRAWKDLCERVGVDSPGRLYVLRHIFRTVADETHDRPAIDLVMGHADRSMGAAYRERVDDARLEAVVGHVRRWLWPKKKAS